MSIDLQSVLVSISKKYNVNYSFDGKPLEYGQVFADEGFLPGLAKRADELCSVCLGYGIGVTYSEVKGAPLGVKVLFDNVTPKILRVMCLTDVLLEFINGSKGKSSVALDELQYHTYST